MRQNRFDFSINTDLKQELRRKQIRYKDLAEALHYGESTINQWMGVPLDLYHRRLIERGIKIVERERHQSGQEIP